MKRYKEYLRRWSNILLTKAAKQQPSNLDTSKIRWHQKMPRPLQTNPAPTIIFLACNSRDNLRIKAPHYFSLKNPTYPTLQSLSAPYCHALFDESSPPVADNLQLWESAWFSSSDATNAIIIIITNYIITSCIIFLITSLLLNYCKDLRGKTITKHTKKNYKAETTFMICDDIHWTIWLHSFLYTTQELCFPQEMKKK